SNNGQTAWVTAGIREHYIVTDTGKPESLESDEQYNHWVFKKNKSGCWIITYVSFNASNEPFP
ncbi:MAG TPA: hypothetical protein VKP08_21900, partial [Anaerolineales bacterium]|nr:hypothetical protein [Anaerolineales bacterium]